MTEQQIKDKVLEVLDDKTLRDKINIDKRQAYELRTRGQSTAKMLDVLWKAGKLSFK